MSNKTVERLSQLQTELALLVKREETLTLLATSPHSPNRDVPQEKLKTLWQRIETIQAEIVELTATPEDPQVPQ